VINSGDSTGATLYGDAFDLYDNARGGNDSLSALNFASSSVSSLYGDALFLVGQGGNDRLMATNSGDASWANLYGDAHFVAASAQGGNDTLTATNFGSASYSYLYGDTSVMNGDAFGDAPLGGDDILTAINSGDGSYSYLFGDASGMSNAKAGNDILTVIDSGDGSHSYLYGDAEVLINVQAGNDVLNGGRGSDYLFGDAQSYYGFSPGSISGGTDILNGGAGDDQLWGGPNNDVIVFNVRSGNDVINDFDQGNLAIGSTATEHDVIDVHDYRFTDWNALQAVTSDDANGNAVIHLSANDSITLAGVQTADLRFVDFII
jgi:Ca2+-binding RTX toxin-like protein